MTHRAETIISTVVTTVTGLTTTGNNVARGRVRSVETHPALSVITGGDDVVLDRSNWPNIGRELNVKIIIHVKNNTTYETEINKIREEVYAALMADHTLGLGFVIDVQPTGDDEPELTGDADQIVGIQQMNFSVMYEHQHDNAGA